MISQMPYILSFVFIFLIVGAVWYVVDHRIGTGLYRWWYDLTHEHPLPAGTDRGFIFGQPAKNRFRSAIILSLVQSFFAIWLTEITVVAEFFTLLFEVPALMLGFYFGPKLDRFWRRKDQVFDKMDEFQSGETSVVQELKEVSQFAAKAVREAIDWDEEAATEKKSQKLPAGDLPAEEAAEQSKPVQKSAETEKTAESPRSMMDNYLRRGEQERGDN